MQFHDILWKVGVAFSHQAQRCFLNLKSKFRSKKQSLVTSKGICGTKYFDPSDSTEGLEKQVRISE